MDSVIILLIIIKPRPFKFFLKHWSIGFPYVQLTTMQLSQALHCDWLNLRKAGAPESRKT